MTDSELQGIATQALNLMKRDFAPGKSNFLLASYHEGDVPPLHRMREIESLIAKRLGEAWLSSGKAKDIGLGLLRIAISMLPPDALVIVSPANLFVATAKLAQLPEAEQRAVWEANHDGHHQSVREGLLELREGFQSLAQTQDRVCHVIQEFYAGHLVGQPEVFMMRQDQLSGRFKMFGGTTVERTR